MSRRHSLIPPPSLNLPLLIPRRRGWARARARTGRSRSNRTSRLCGSIRRGEKRRRETGKSQHPTDNNKMNNPDPLLPRDILRPNRRPSSSNPPLLPPRILSTLRPKMAPRIKMPQGIPINEPRRIFRVIPPFPLSRRRRKPTTHPRSSLISLPRPSSPRPLGRPPSSPIPALRIEARRRAPERSPAFTQPARRPRTGVAALVQVCAVAAVAAGRVRAGSAVVGLVEAMLTVVGGAFFGVAEHVVGGGDAGEAGAGVGVFAVAVGVVAEGEGVEFSLVFCGCVS